VQTLASLLQRQPSLSQSETGSDAVVAASKGQSQAFQSHEVDEPDVDQSQAWHLLTELSQCLAVQLALRYSSLLFISFNYRLTHSINIYNALL